MTPRETTLTAALDANVALRVQAERLIAAYVAPESNRAAIVNELIALVDGPQRREAQRLAAVALGRAALAVCDWLRAMRVSSEHSGAWR